MVRKKDHFWEYVEELDGRFKCNFCGREFAGGAPRIKSHLAGVKGRDIDICTKVRDDVQAKAYLAIGGHSKMPKITSNSSNVEQSKEVSTSMSNDLHQTTILEMCKKKDNGHGYKSSNQHSVDKLLTQHIILNNISFNVVQTPAFIRFVQGVAEYGHGYKLPSYSTLRTKLIPNSRIEVEEYISNVKKSWVTTGCTLMSDIWSDMKQRAFINIIAYSPRGAVFMRSIDVSQERKTEFFLKQIISAVIEEIGPNHVVQFIADNATNFESAGYMLIGKYPHLYKTRCAAHGVQLLLKDIYEEVNWVQKVIDDAKSIVAYMYKHTIVLSLMRAHTNNKELKHPCTTRFASNFLMLQSILNVESELQLLVASSDWSGLDYSKKDIAKEVTNIIQSTEFWSQGHEVLLVLEPLVRVLRLVDGDGSTAGYLYEAMERAREAIQQRCGNNQEKYIRMWELFERRRTQNIIHPIHCAAAFLNPAYMYSGTFTENREMKEGISFILENLVAPEEKREFMGQVQLYRMKLSCLFTETAMTMLKTSHPRIWWDYCGDSLPVLKKYAIRILSQPCSSSSCERNWSAFEAAQTKKRNRLTPKMLDDLVYVRMNTMMMEKFNTLEARDVELIDLDKLNELPEHEYVSQEQDTENDKLAEEVENINDTENDKLAEEVENINDDVIDDTDLSCSNEMGPSQNVELEAAKFLQKLIQSSKDEPAKLATKLYVILQHMKSSGKEHSMPYQVISRANELIVNQHGLDIEALRLSRLPLSGGNQIGDSATAQFAGCSQAGGVANDSKVGFAENEVSKVDPFASNRPPVGPSSAGHDYYQGSLAHRSANSHSQERQQKDGKEATTKRKRGEASLPMEQHIDNTQQLDTWNAVVNPRKGKMNKVEPQASLSVKGGERTNFNMVPSSGQMEHFASLSGSMRPMLRVNQEGQHAIERQLDSSNISNSMLRAPNPKFPEEVEVSSAHNASQQGGSLPSHDIRGVWNQNKTGLPFEKSQIPRFPSNVPGNMMSEIPTQQSTTPSLGSGKDMEDVSAFKLWI